MLFSSKISNSVLNGLEARGYSLESLLATTEIPEEFLRDPSSWVEADKMEEFLRLAEREFLYSKNQPTNDDTGTPKNAGVDDSIPFLEQVGHTSIELRSWGVLDGVIRMMQSPQDLFAQPDRLISYFISPPPPIAQLQKAEQSLSFQIPISSDEYPLVTQYLRAAFEALPLYLGQSLAKATWTVTEFKIVWNQDQGSLFGEAEDPGRVMSPGSAQALIQSLERSQRELERKNLELTEKNQKLQAGNVETEKQLRAQVYSEKLEGVVELASGLANEMSLPLTAIQGNVARMHDYFARAQQLITLLIGQNRKTAQVQEAMRRVDWEFICQQHPVLIQESRAGLEKMKEALVEMSTVAGAVPSEPSPSEKVSANLNQVVENSLKMIQPFISSGIQIDRHLLLDRDVKVYPSRIEQAVTNILTSAVQSIGQSANGKGTVRVSTRPKGNWAEIEISDTGSGMDAKTKAHIFDSGVGLSIAHSIVKMHDGSIRVSSQPGRGSTFLIDLPI